MKKKTWKQIKIASMQQTFGHYIAEFEGHNDDRRVFVNIYNQIMRALESLPDEPDSYVKVAMWRQINRDKNTLYDILGRFCDEEEE